jgi:hypothetical protein
LPDGSTSVSIKRIIPNVSVTDAAAGHEFHTEFLGPEKAFDLGWIASFRSPANQAAQVSLVSGHARLTKTPCGQLTSTTSMRPSLAKATGMLRDCDKCQAYIADVHGAFRSGS